MLGWLRQWSAIVTRRTSLEQVLDGMYGLWSVSCQNLLSEQERGRLCLLSMHVVWLCLRGVWALAFLGVGWLEKCSLSRDDEVLAIDMNGRLLRLVSSSDVITQCRVSWEKCIAKDSPSQERLWLDLCTRRKKWEIGQVRKARTTC
jgi:hypothetical protein